MLELWGRKNAYNVQKVLWMLAELGLEYRHHDLGSQSGDLHSEAYLAINPHARIPSLRDQGEVIWESNSILRYLAAEYSAGDLWPQQALARSRAERWMDWELSKLQNDFIDLFWGYYRCPEKVRDLAVIEQARKRCDAHFRLLDAHFREHAYLAGERFTMAEIAVATCLYRYLHMGLNLQLPVRVADWYQRLTTRAAYRASIMVPFDELRAREEF